MAEKVAKLGIARDNNFMYYIKKGGVWRVPRKQPGVPKGKQEMVQDAGIQQDVNFIYFLDKKGDVSRAQRAVGGQKRKKAVRTAKAASGKAKKVVKKLVKKPAKAKKPVKKGKKR